jgi:cysteinyl-tRNA synthetase
MTLKLYNTMSRTLEPLKLQNDKSVSLYTCGLTVYSQPHIGNWVAYVYWDILVRALKANGLSVNRVQNITDVGHLTSDEDAGEDKMLSSALKEGITAWDVAEKYIKIADEEAYNQLGLLRPDHMPRATEYIPQQIAFVEELEKKGFTYAIADGVYFDTSKLSDYGKLARLDIDGLQFGVRVADTGKKTPTDFALWKFSPEGQKRDMEWESPWGLGFPGWHLECSVMARELLGDTIDIHTGGIDHIPVHHTNEIAQSEAFTGKTFANMWIHANHIKVDGTKMSKSLGNIYTLKDISDKGFDIDAFKLMILSKHYRTEGNFTWEILEAAQNRLNELRAWADLRYQTTTNVMPDELDELFKDTRAGMLDAINDDLNTPLALAALNKLVSYMSNIAIPGVEGKYTDGTLGFIDDLLGLNLSNRPDITDEQKTLIKQREEARANKDFEGSDRLRAELENHGLLVRDTPNNGPVWSRK